MNLAYKRGTLSGRPFLVANYREVSYLPKSVYLLDLTY